MENVSKVCRRHFNIVWKLNIKMLDYIVGADPGFLERGGGVGGHIYIYAKKIYIYKGVGVRCADLISLFLNTPLK